MVWFYPSILRNLVMKGENEKEREGRRGKKGGREGRMGRERGHER